MTFPPAVAIDYDSGLPPDPRVVERAAPTLTLEIFAGRSFERFWPVVWNRTGKRIDASSWGVRFVIRRTIDATPLIERENTDAALSWSSAATAWRLYLSPTVTAGLSPVSYPTLRPHRYELAVWDLEMTPDTWDLPMPPRPFIFAGGQCRIYTGG